MGFSTQQTVQDAPLGEIDHLRPDPTPPVFSAEEKTDEDDNAWGQRPF
jgi:hypothetical protein